MSSRSRSAFVVTAPEDAGAWEELVARAGFRVEQRLEAPLGPDGDWAARSGTVLLVLRQQASPPVPRRRNRQR